jgi:membrane-associated phospholipid phosphatase
MSGALISAKPPAWPDRGRFLAFLRFLLWFYLAFFPVYFGAGAIAAQSGRATEWFFAWEREIPLIRWMIWPYFSIFPLFLLPLFHLNPQQIARLSRQSTLTILIAGLFFVLLPMRRGFAASPVDGCYRPIFGLLGSVDTPHNLAPSLHVAFGALILLACAERTTPAWARLYFLLFAVLSTSTVLVHQHHVVDVVTGAALAVLVRRMAPIDPRLRPSCADA